MTPELLRQADYCLSKCGRPVPPDWATSVLYLPRGMSMQVQLGQQVAQTIARKIVGDADFELCAISISAPVLATATGTPGPQLYCQVELPNGSHLFSTLIDISQVQGFGSNRYVLSEPLICPLESRFILTFNTAVPVATNLQPVMVLFEGADRYVLVNGQPVRSPHAFAGAWPRVGGDGNENILAPSWQQGFTLEPPAGWDYEPHVPVSVPVVGQPGAVLIPGLAGVFSPPGFSVISLPNVNASAATATAVIQVDQTNDLQIRRFLFELHADPSVGVGHRLMVRISTASGYALTEDYIEAERLIGSSFLAKPWDVLAGDRILFDLKAKTDIIEVPPTPPANFYFRAFADGVRKIRLAG